jgi:catechol 2,3-dioxygenase-like lactoylglutathione lyase family enzyme
VTFYRDKLGWAVVHQEPGFAIVERDQVALHLWAAADESWRTRASASPVVSGAESFIAGTASCRVHVDGIDGLYRSLDPLGTREFGILDPDGNLITFAERVPAAEPA